MTATASWSVDEERQTAFITLSGDRNPLHVDPIRARRLPFGRVAVHGVHLLLDTLERIAASPASSGRALRRIRCTFRHPVGLDDPLTTTIDDGDLDEVRAVVMVDVWVAADIRVELGDPASTPPPSAVTTPPTDTLPQVHRIGDLVDHAGETDVAADVAAAERMFPQLLDLVGPARLAELASLTRIVGMHVPGLHSLFSALDVAIEPEADRESIRYSVTTADDRFCRVVIDVTGPTVHGTLTAFVRPGPVEQALGETRPRTDEFSGQRWLVVGGSRGLGAAAVQLLAAGGADVRFTFRAGADEAAELERSTGARAFPLDVLERPVGVAGGITSHITADGWWPTHLAYMASPPIFDGMGGVYSDALHRRFHAVYVEAFAGIVAELDAERVRGIVWPSSEAVDHDVAGLAEYADAKRAGERVCHELAATHPGLTVHAPRLPRLLTDQSTSFVPTDYGDTAVEMLAALRGVSG